MQEQRDVITGTVADATSQGVSVLMSAKVAGDPSQSSSAVTANSHLKLHPQAFREGLVGLASQEFIDKVVTACSEGVNIGYDGPRVRQEHHNWPSTTEHADAVAASIIKDINRGTTAGPFLSPPFSTFVGSPMGCFQKKRSSKYRVIHDLSYPPGSSINSFIDIDQFRVQYLSFDDVVNNIQQLGQGTLLAKLDLEDAFKHIPVRQEDWPLLGYTFTVTDPSSHQPIKLYFFDKVLQFGCRSSPKLFNDIAAATNLVMFKNGVSYSDHYLDDFVTMGPPRSNECADNLNIMLQTCADVGFAVNPHKVVQPTTTLEFLGIVLDTEKMEMRISTERMHDILSELQQWLFKKRATKRQLLSLIGKLMFVCRVVKPGRIFVQRLINLSKSVSCLHHKIRITSDAMFDIQWWLKFLPSWNRKSVFYNAQWIDSDVLHLYTDASNVAVAAYYNGHWFAIPFQGVFVTLGMFSINWRELCAIALALATWGEQWQGQRIVLHCDNMCVVECLTRGCSRSPDMMRLIRNMFFLCAQYSVEISARYVNTKNNDIADSLSRLQFDRFFECAPMADRYMTAPNTMVL